MPVRQCRHVRRCRCARTAKDRDGEVLRGRGCLVRGQGSGPPTPAAGAAGAATAAPATGRGVATRAAVLSWSGGSDTKTLEEMPPSAPRPPCPPLPGFPPAPPCPGGRMPCTVRWPSVPWPPFPPCPPYPPSPPSPPGRPLATRVSGPVSSPMAISAILLGPPFRPLAPSPPAVPSPPSPPWHAPGTTGPASQSQPSQVGVVGAATPLGPPVPYPGPPVRRDRRAGRRGGRRDKGPARSRSAPGRPPIAVNPLHGQHQQVPPHGHDRARRQVQAADIDHVQDVVAVVDVPVLVADAEVPAFARTDVPVPHAQDRVGNGKCIIALASSPGRSGRRRRPRPRSCRAHPARWRGGARWRDRRTPPGAGGAAPAVAADSARTAATVGRDG